MVRSIKIFFSQFRNYMTGIAALLKDIFLFSPVLMVKMLALSILGTTLQAVALGSTFFVLKQLRNGLYVDIHRTVPMVHASVHVTILFMAVLMLLGLAVLLLYLAEKAAFRLSRLYANHCAMELIETFPAIAGQKKNPAIHPRNGLPATFALELKRRGTILEIAVRNLIRAPKSFFQLFYGAGFLLYLEPRLTLILLIVTFPLLIPLNRLTRTVKDSEKMRQQASAGMRTDAEMLARESGRLLSGFEETGRRLQELFDASSYATSTYYRYRRVSGQAGARAVAGTALVITGMVCMLYFGMFFGDGRLPIALIVVYIGALRLTATSGQQTVSRVAGYARFYDRVQAILNDRPRAALRPDNPGISRDLGIQGIDLSRNSGADTTIRENGPFAVMGSFPLFSLNRYVIASLLPRMNKRRRQAIITGMTVVSETPCLPMNVTWRRLLGINVLDETARRQLESGCFLLTGRDVSGHMEQPVGGAGGLSPPEAIEAMLLRACFQAAPVVIIMDAAFEAIGVEAVNHWKRMLEDRLLLIYYQYDGPFFARWGETHAALVPSDTQKPAGVASVEWVKANMDQVREILRGEGDGGEQSDNDAEWDDEDDE